MKRVSMAVTSQTIITIWLLVLSHATTLVSLSCPAGTFPGTIFCVDCIAGQYSSGSGVLYNTCANCLPGTFSGASGASACQYCPSGTYDDAGGATECTECSPGYGLGLTVCADCCQTCVAAVLPAVFNQSFVADTGNSYIRQVSLSNGWALDPSNTFRLKGTVTNDFNVFYSSDGMNAIFIWQGRAIYTYNNNNGGAGLIVGSSSSLGYVDGTNAATRFSGASNGFHRDWYSIFIVEPYHVRLGNYFNNQWSTLLGINGLHYCPSSSGPIAFSDVNLDNPTGIYASQSQNFILVLDKWQNVLYHANLEQKIAYIIAGKCGTNGYADGPGSKSMFNNPTDIQVSPDETFAIISDTSNNVFRKILFSNISDPTAPTIVTTIIGAVGVSGDVNGYGTDARIGVVEYFGLSPGGSLILFGDNNQIKMADLSVFPFKVSTFSGNSTPGFGFGANTMYKQPKRVATTACKVLCPPNYYVVVGSTQCTPCPANSTSPAKAITCTANTGYYMIGSTLSTLSTGRCTGVYQCSTGTYTVAPCTATTDVVCAQCPSGTFSPRNSAFCYPCTTQCPVGTVRSSDCNITNDLGCVNCSAGTYLDDRSTTSCRSCFKGLYSLAGASTCTLCQSGWYSPALSPTCTLCPAGSYTPAYSSVCTICSPGSFSTTPAAYCTACQAGTYSSISGANTTSVCVSCTAGWYSFAGASVCTICQTGTYSGASAPSCTSCLAGTYSSITEANASSACIPCKVGSYSNTPASSACTQCPTALSTPSTGATDPAQCNICIIGASTASGVCALCGAGTYSNSTGATACTNCSSNAFSPVSASACQTCAAGNYLFSYTIISTAAQRFSSVSYTYPNTMIPTQVGLYCSNYRTATTFAGEGNDCSNINYCPWPMDAGCYVTYNGRIPTGFICDAGCVTASSCNGVQNGILTSPGNIGDPNSCQIQCNPGYKLQNRACVLIGNCDICPNGTYSPAGSTTCTTCTNGTFANSPGSTACSTCVSCNAGYYPANCGLSIGVCTQCPVGYYSKAGATVCASCPLGTYSTLAGANSSSVCTKCAIGAYSSYPSSNCTLCPTGYTTEATGTSFLSSCNTCIQGAYYSNYTAGVCALCGMGTFTQTLNSSQCSNCTSGWYSDNGASVCQACQAGKYFFSTTVADPAAPVQAATASYMPAFSPVTLVAGQYCSNYFTEFIYRSYPTTDFDFTYCNDLGNPSYAYCPWKKWSGCVETGYASWCTDTTPSPGHTTPKCPYEFDCLAGCKTASPCTNAVGNSTYTGPGVNGNPNSCPFACNPGYMLVNGSCVLIGHCANCGPGTYSSTGLSSCVQCSTGRFTTAMGSTSCDSSCITCINGFFVQYCGISQGVCTSCNNI